MKIPATMNRAACAVLFVVSVAITFAQAPRHRGDPAGAAVHRARIGIDANPKTSSDYGQDAWAESIALMRTTGANHFHYGKVWSDIEPRPGVYRTDAVRSMAALSSPLPIAFNLRIVDAGARNMPDEYKTLAWDSPAMVRHLLDVIEQVSPILGDRPWSYAIGNEIDMYLASRPAEVTPYARMLQQVKARIKTLHPGVGLTTTFQFSAASQLRTQFAPIVAVLDHVSFTYYPLGVNFAVRPEASITTDLQTMIAVAAPRPVFLQEIGYPTSALLGSSPERQSAFVRLAFEAIRAAGPAKVFGATYLFQADLPQWSVDQVAVAYGIQSATFRAFIGTLGLRDEKDRPRPAWDEFVRQAQLIGPPF